MEHSQRKDFLSINAKVLHENSNNDIKPNRCSQCEYSASLAYNLRRHLKTHGAEKSHKCNQCNYASYQAGNLKTHLKTHNGEKLYKCNQCAYASSRADHLITHRKSHDGEKSMKCNQCDYASSHAGHLKTHLKTHIALWKHFRVWQSLEWSPIPIALKNQKIMDKTKIWVNWTSLQRLGGKL